MGLSVVFVHHQIECAPRCWAKVADQLKEIDKHRPSHSETALYGIWRSQIGLPRDTITMISKWPNADMAKSGTAQIHNQLGLVKSYAATLMTPTLRPENTKPPERQGNYAFRWFTTPTEKFEEFLSLCKEAWPSFVSSYESQIIGLWRLANSLPHSSHEKFGAEDDDNISTVLLTRRPDLSMWERSKIPQTAEEIETRQKLSRRYDLCDQNMVFTTTLLTASDQNDDVGWA